MRILKYTCQTTLFSLLMLCGMPAHTAEAPRLYDVEVIIFSHNSQSDQGESWYTPDGNAGRARGYFPENQFTELSSSHFSLSPVRYSLQKGGEYTVLFHRAWRQLAYSSANAADYPVNSFAEGSRNSVKGSIRLVRERYLHLDVDLLLMESAGTAPGLYSDGPGNAPAYRLAEKRRIKSSTLHYFDHPRFGMLAIVTPYRTAPEASAETGAEQPAAEPEPALDSTPITADERLTR
jgi:hypothetical protein